MLYRIREMKNKWCHQWHIESNWPSHKRTTINSPSFHSFRRWGLLNVDPMQSSPTYCSPTRLLPVWIGNHMLTLLLYCSDDEDGGGERDTPETKRISALYNYFLQERGSWRKNMGKNMRMEECNRWESEYQPNTRWSWPMDMTQQFRIDHRSSTPIPVLSIEIPCHEARQRSTVTLARSSTHSQKCERSSFAASSDGGQRT